ncbi:MAG: MBL fold metallo-hydrolase [Clostridia bacterium]|nr:MBL fold metallo-hydrolase [Clostridia bacterium]
MPTLHMLHSTQDTINTSFILQSETSTIVFDGGFPCEADYLASYLANLGGHVDAWFFTHIHDDHLGAALDVKEKHPEIKVDRYCFNFPSVEFLNKYEPKQSVFSSEELYHRTMALTADGSVQTIVKTGDVYDFDGFSVEVLRTPVEEIANNINDTSCVYRVTVGDKILLFLGDLGVAGGRHLLANTDPGKLKADYVQMAHHGQGGVDRPVYEAIKPTYCLWCTPTWLWDNRGEGGYDTGPFRTVIVRGWMSDIGGIKKHYLMQEGDHVIAM